MNRIHIDQCPICGNTEKSIALTCKDHYATGENFDIYRCNSCQFMFTQDFPCEAEIGRYYDTKDYISHSNTNKGLVNKIYHRVRKHMMHKKAMLQNQSLFYYKHKILEQQLMIPQWCRLKSISSLPCLFF